MTQASDASDTAPRKPLTSRLAPPVRLRPLSRNLIIPVQLLWSLVFIFSLAVVAFGTVHAVRGAYDVRPAFASLGLDFDIANDGMVRVEIEGDRAPAGRAGQLYTVTAIDGRPVARNILVGDLAERLRAPAGATRTIDLEASNGERLRLTDWAVEAEARDVVELRDLRLIARLTSGLLACAALLLCSFLLARRRPSDPVALILAFAFAGMAATIDPPLAMWMAFGWPAAYDIISSVWFYLLLVALAAFPDGIFVPRFYRWLLYLGIPLAIFVSLPNVDENVQVFAGIGALFAMLVGQIRRFRRLGPGIERQQIKWAGFGFALGFVLIFIAFVLLLFVPDNPTARGEILSLVITLIFSLGMAAIPLGLLIALIRFRLWEADKVISRSAAYALVTMIVGAFWAATSDLAEMLVTFAIGQDHETAATALSAVVAAGVFAPTQKFVLGWTKQRFSGPSAKLDQLIEQLREWRLTLDPQEIAGRALAAIGDAIHPRGAMIVTTDGMGEPVLGHTGDPPEAGDVRHRIALDDDRGTVATLVLGPRSDGNRYGREELEAIREVAPAIGNALRPSLERFNRDSMMLRTIDQMRRRIDELEGKRPVHGQS